MGQKVCITKHPEEDRPCAARCAHSLTECPQCGGVDFLPEEEFDALMEQGQAEEKPKRGRGGKPVPDAPQA